MSPFKTVSNAARRFFSLVALVVITTLGCVLAQPAKADDGGSHRIQITPTQHALGDLTPGQSYSGTFRLENPTDEGIPISLEVSPYSVSGQNYTPDYEKNTGYTEIVDWVALDENSVVVAPHGSANINYTVTVPQDAPGGAQTSAIRLFAQNALNSESGTGVSMRAGAAYLLYGNVKGETRRVGKIIENKIPSFIFEPPIVASSIVKNEGNIYTGVEVKLEVRTAFGDGVVYTNEADDRNPVVFPETERYQEVSWDGAPQLGLFKVKQTVKIFDEVSEVEKLVFICPIWFLFIIILMVGIIVFEIVSHILRARAIKKARNEYGPSSDRSSITSDAPSHSSHDDTPDTPSAD